MDNLYFTNDQVNGLRMWAGTNEPSMDHDYGGFVADRDCRPVCSLERHHIPSITDDLPQGRCKLRVPMAGAVAGLSGR